MCQNVTEVVSSLVTVSDKSEGAILLERNQMKVE